MEYSVLAYYFFTFIENPAAEVLRHKEFFSTRDIRGRIYLSQEGINGQMSCPAPLAQEYMEWLRSDPRFKEIEFKIHTWTEHCFPRATVKVRPQLVALDTQVNLSKIGVHLSPEEWKAKLDARDEKTALIDVRNQYEWNIGRFEGAELPKLEKFREFSAYARELKTQYNPQEAKVMMYCTGGIRCELYSALMREEGFDHVYQLQGGVIKYGLHVGSKHWKGRLFVFDDRLSVPISEKDPAEIISHCTRCPTLTDAYFNCANMDCNELFLSCPDCAEKTKGCCSTACGNAPRIRPYHKQDRPKPFRRLSHLF